MQEADSGQTGEVAQKELGGREWPRSVEQCRRWPGLELVRKGLGGVKAALDGSLDGWMWMCEEKGGEERKDFSLRVRG